MTNYNKFAIVCQGMLYVQLVVMTYARTLDFKTRYHTAMRKTQLYVAIGGALLLALLCIAGKILMTLDPLRQSGLNDEELLLFRYLLTVYELSKVPLYDLPRDAESVRIFNEISQVGLCRECGSVFIDLDGACPNHHLLARMDKASFVARMHRWEELRDAYCKHIKQRTMTRVQAIKMYRMIQHPLER